MTAESGEPSRDPEERASRDLPITPSEGLSLPRGRRALDFVRRVYEKAAEDNIFFLAGAISFNLLMAVVPLFLFAIGMAGLLLTARFEEAAPSILLDLLVENLPVLGGESELRGAVQQQLESLLDQWKGFSGIGAALLVWFSTRLVGTLRTALREVFDVAEDRGVIGGKIFDAKVVVVGGLLFLVNIGVTTAVTVAQAYGVDVLGLEPRAVTLVERTVAWGLSLTSIWLLFVMIYRFLPARWIPWRTALIAATFTAVLHEALKWGFGWYATNVASYGDWSSNLVTVAVLFLWIYYEAIVFILGGEVAQVWTMRRALKLKTRRALFGETRPAKVLEGADGEGSKSDEMEGR